MRLTASGLARFWVWSAAGYGRGDLRAFDRWTGLSVPIFVLVALFFTLSVERSPLKTVTAAAGWGVCFVVGETMALALLLGPWVGAFSFPVVPCWGVAAILALILAGGLEPDRGSVAAAGAIPVACLAAFVAYERATRPLDDLLIYFGPDVTREQVEYVWNDVLGRRAGSVSLPADGVLRLGYATYNDRPAIRVAFATGASRSRRAEVREALRKVATVAELVDTDPLPRRMAAREGQLPVRIGPDAIVRPEPAPVR